MPYPGADVHGVIVDEPLFLLIARLEIRKAIRLRYPVSALSVWPRLMSRRKIADPRLVTEPLARAISRVIRGTDVIGLPATTTHLWVLLVDADWDELPAITLRIGDSVGERLFELDGERTRLALDMGAACFPATASTETDLVAQAERGVGERHSDRPESRG